MENNEATLPRAAAPHTSSMLGRGFATLAVVIALSLWCAAESLHPAGGWMARQGADMLVIALAAFILAAASASGWTGLALSALAGGALVCLSMEVAFAARALAAVSVAALCYAVWQRRVTIAGQAPWRFAAGAAAIPVGLWVALRLDAAVYAAALGAVLTGYVLYAFARGTAARRAGAARRGLAAALARLPEPLVAVSGLLAVAGFGLLARVL